ncbi:hypothetical protein Q5752_005643 [Cryptotrichosporon argae]
MRGFLSAISTAARAGPSRARTVSTEAAASTYPFSKTALVLPSTLTPDSPASLHRPRAGASLLSHLNASALSSSPNARFAPLFARRSPSRLATGSVLTVLTSSSPTAAGIAPFSGVLTRVRRRGVDTAFTLRNIVHKTGVELGFKLHSPLLRDIRVVRRAQGRKGGIKDLRRARVDYLRDRPAVMAQIAGALKAARS